MLGRRDAVAKLEHELEQLDERITAEVAERESYAAAIANAVGAREALADAEADGKITASAATKELANLEAAIKTAQTRDEHRGRIVARLEQQREELELQLGRARYEERREQAEAASRNQAEAAETVGRILQTVLAAAANLSEARARTAELCAAANELRDDEPAPTVIDEPDWPDVGPLVALLKSGSARPNAHEARDLHAYQARADSLLSQNLNEIVQQVVGLKPDLRMDGLLRRLRENGVLGGRGADPAPEIVEQATARLRSAVQDRVRRGHDDPEALDLLGVRTHA